MDLDDSLLVSTGVVWGKFTDVLDQASDRYGQVSTLLGASVCKKFSANGSTPRMVGAIRRADTSRFIRGADINTVAEIGIDMAAQSVLDQHLVFADAPQRHELIVSGITDIRAYSDLLEYLQSLEFVDNLMLMSMWQNTLKLRVNTAATDEQLRNLLLDDGRFDLASKSTSVIPNARTPAPEFVWRALR